MYGVEHLQHVHQQTMAQLNREQRYAARKRKAESVRWERSLDKLKSLLHKQPWS